MAGVVDAATVFPYPFNMPVSDRLLREVREVSQDLGLVLLVHGPMWELYTASIYPHVRTLGVRMVQEALDFAAHIGAVHITLHPGPNRWPGVWPQLVQAAIDAQTQSFAELASFASTLGVQIGIENMLPGDDCLPGYDDLSQIYPVLDHVPGVGVTLDVGHLHVLGLDQAQVIRRLGSRLNHLHVHDNHGQWDEHLPVGYGTIDWGCVCQALRDIGYGGVLEVERSLADGGVESSLAVLKRALDPARA
jgi:sugar phosphate isomerase/epimerase